MTERRDITSFKLQYTRFRFSFNCSVFSPISAPISLFTKLPTIGSFLTKVNHSFVVIVFGSRIQQLTVCVIPSAVITYNPNLRIFLLSYKRSDSGSYDIRVKRFGSVRKYRTDSEFQIYSSHFHSILLYHFQQSRIQVGICNTIRITCFYRSQHSGIRKILALNVHLKRRRNGSFHIYRRSIPFESDGCFIALVNIQHVRIIDILQNSRLSYAFIVNHLIQVAFASCEASQQPTKEHIFYCFHNDKFFELRKYCLFSSYNHRSAASYH